MLKKQLLLILFLLAVGSANAELVAPSTASVDASQTESNAAIHAELRDLLLGIETAINTEKYGDLKQYFDAKLHVTTINQNLILNRFKTS